MPFYRVLKVALDEKETVTFYKECLIFVAEKWYAALGYDYFILLLRILTIGQRWSSESCGDFVPSLKKERITSDISTLSMYWSNYYVVGSVASFELTG